MQQDEISVFFQTLWQGHFEQARLLLNDLPLLGPRAERIRGHYGAQILIHEGKHREAALALSEIIETHDSYIGIRIDLASCYYELKSFSLMQVQVKEIENILHSLPCPISHDRQIRYRVWLAKHYENLGQIGPACKALLVTEKLILNDLDFEQRVWFEIQRLRLFSLFGQPEDVHASYLFLIQILEKNLPENLHIEWRHSLMLAETHLFGHEYGLSRLQEILQVNGISLQQKGFCLADFVSANKLLGRSLKIVDEGLKEIAFNEVLPVFEKTLFRLQFLQQFDPAVFIVESHYLSPYEHLLLLLFSLDSRAKALQESLRQETLNKFKFLLLSLDNSSRQMWMQMAQKLQSSEEQLQFYFDGKRITFQNQNLKTGPVEIVSSLLSHTSHENEVSPIDLCEILWGYFDESHISRLRMIIKRLNNEMLEVFAHGPLLRMTKRRIQVLKYFTVVHADANLNKVAKKHGH